MIEVNGKYANAKVYTDVVDDESIRQVTELLNQTYVGGSRIRMMPDIHAGAGCTIGTTMTISDKVCPNLVGVDIGCGMETTQIKESELDVKKLDEVIREFVPSGFAIRTFPHEYSKNIDLDKLYCAKSVDTSRARHSIGTLGGGNHFIEANKDDDGNIYIVIHSGSRHLGLQIANYYQNAAYKNLSSFGKDEISDVIEELKALGREKEIQEAIREMKSKKPQVPKALAYVEGSLLEQYLHDMEIAQRFAAINRKAMMDVIIENIGCHVVDQFTTVHNYIDLDNMILRKGAVSAQAGEKLLIPINMRDGSLICEGKGNEDWNCSAPHGAGRLMSRTAAKEKFSVQEFQRQMEGIYTTSVGIDTLDECPMAYKSMSDIVDNISPTAEIKNVIKPIYNFKAGDGA